MIGLFVGLGGYSLALYGIHRDDWRQITKARVVGVGLALTAYAILTV